MAKSKIATAYVQVLPSMGGVKPKVENAFIGAGESAGGSLGSALSSALKRAIATAGIGKMLGDAIKAGANLEQSLGGIETLFKDSADIVVKNAEQAYKTAGMSANEYMETVTSFSASLLQGLSGDTEKAASVADMALTDMSDNANKMGTSMELIQNAYQGFAKQNYTMLDNLKLGYGGTKTEMERLLADAEKLTGVKYDISNLADVYSAIHAIQGEIGITGTTAKEASETLSGSFASMKAAFSDLIANLALGRDMETSLQALTDTAFTFLVGNLLPAVGRVLEGLPTVFSTAFSAAIRGLNIAADNADALLQQGVDLVIGIGTSIITASPYLAEAALNIVAAIGNAIISTDWVQIGQDTISGLRSSLDLAAAEILGTDGNIVQSVLDAIKTNLPTVLSGGGKIISSLLDGILENTPDLITAAGELADQFLNAILSALPELFASGIQLVEKIGSGICNNLPAIASAAGDVLTKLISTIAKSLPQIIQQGISLAVSLGKGLINAVPSVLSAAGTLALKILGAIGNIDWLQLGKDIINGLIKGIGAMGGALWDAAVNVAKSALNAIKKFFGIASPSKVMRDQVGKFIPAGLAVGIEANTKPLTDAMHNLSNMTTGTLQTQLRTDNMLSVAAGTASAPGNVFFEIHIHGAEGQSEEALVNALMERIQFEAERRGMRLYAH